MSPSRLVSVREMYADCGVSKCRHACWRRMEDRGMTDQRLVAGMVGGGPGAMIGGAHRHAMWLDNQYVLAAGIFGRDRAASAEFAKSLGVERVYDDYRDMAEREADRDDGVDVVAVVTPNDTHFEITKAF